jgi:glycosyltransferase involved in cell wall biosynthesis
MTQMSDDIPALVIVGKRGWNAEAAIDMLERSPAVSRHVIVSGLTTPGLKRLMDNATALLAPSVAEGFGLPVAEVLAAGVRVIGARIPSFGELASDESASQNFLLIDTLDGVGWLNAIKGACRTAASIRNKPASIAQQFREHD